jgi:flagellar motor switch/type III secretory pathway protein FliN
MKDVHEVARTKEESFRSQIEEIVNLKQMQIVKLQKEASATARILSNRTRVGRGCRATFRGAGLSQGHIKN